MVVPLKGNGPRSEDGCLAARLFHRGVRPPSSDDIGRDCGPPPPGSLDADDGSHLVGKGIREFLTVALRCHTLAELRIECRLAGLPHFGRKEELISRLIAGAKPTRADDDPQFLHASPSLGADGGRSSLNRRRRASAPCLLSPARVLLTPRVTDSADDALPRRSDRPPSSIGDDSSPPCVSPCRRRILLKRRWSCEGPPAQLLVTPTTPECLLGAHASTPEGPSKAHLVVPRVLFPDDACGPCSPMPRRRRTSKGGATNQAAPVALFTPLQDARGCYPSMQMRRRRRTSKGPAMDV